jgi:hypothetical protein
MFTPNAVFKMVASENSYEEGTDVWNAMVDCFVCDTWEGISVLEMMVYNDLPFSYYERLLPKLVADGAIELVKPA